MAWALFRGFLVLFGKAIPWMIPDKKNHTIHFLSNSRTSLG
jgi:hypothetical protein